MTLADFISRVRTDLDDTNASNYRWTDAQLTRHIEKAVRLYSAVSPLQIVVDKPTTAGSRTIDLAAETDLIIVYHVEYPIGEYPPYLQQFSFFQDTLTIEMAQLGDGSNARLYCGKLHAVTASGSTIPPVHEEIICAGAEAFALVQKGVFATDRVSIGGQATATEFARQARELRDRFDRSLAKLQRRLKTARLFTPAVVPVTSDTDVNRPEGA